MQLLRKKESRRSGENEERRKVDRIKLRTNGAAVKVNINRLHFTLERQKGKERKRYSKK